MKLAIVILNYNGKALLEKFLPSVVRNSVGANIYVADNASTDDSIEFLGLHYPGIKIIQNERNYGFATGYNRALKNIDEELLCLLNNDVEVSANWLAPIQNEFRLNAITAIVQPKILAFEDKDSFEYAGASGGYIDKYGFPYCRGRIFETVEKDIGQYNTPSKILWASGACFFIRNSVFKEFKGFDDKFFAHMEEIDLCWRAFNQGLVAKAVPTSTVYHLGGGTLKYGSPRKTYLNFRNSLFTLLKNVPNNLFWTILIRLKLDGIAALKFLFQLKFLHFLAVLRAHLSFYYNLPFYLGQRSNIKTDKKYYKVKSIVWSYFIRGIKTFNCL